MHYFIQKITIDNGDYMVKVPGEMMFEKHNYQMDQAAKVIYLNVSTRLQQQISLENIKTIFSHVDEYIKQKNLLGISPNMFDPECSLYLTEALIEEDIFLGTIDYDELFLAELFYMKLIGLLDEEE